MRACAEAYCGELPPPKPQHCTDGDPDSWAALAKAILYDDHDVGANTPDWLREVLDTLADLKCVYRATLPPAPNE
jgi:hypothetical protein